MHQKSISSIPASLVRLVAALTVVVLCAGCQSGVALPSVVSTTATVPPQPSPTPISLIATPDAAVSDTARKLRGYVANDDSGAMFVAWTETGDTLSGTMQLASPDTSSQYGIRANNVSFTGVRSGNHLSITVPQGFGTANTFSGEFNGPLLTLFFPDSRGTITPVVLHPGTVAEYNQAVIGLQQQVGQQVAQAQAAQATTAAYAKLGTATASALYSQQENVRAANTGVADALRQLTRAVNDLAQDSTFDFPLEESNQTNLQTANQQLRKDAAKPPVDCMQIQFDLDNVELYASPVSDAHSFMQSKTDRIQQESATVKALVQDVQRAYTDTSTATAANTTGIPAPQFTQEDVTKAVTTAQQQIDRSMQAIQDAQQRLTGYEQQAAQTLKDAKSLVARVKCS